MLLKLLHGQKYLMLSMNDVTYCDTSSHTYDGGCQFLSKICYISSIYSLTEGRIYKVFFHFGANIFRFAITKLLTLFLAWLNPLHFLRQRKKKGLNTWIAIQNLYFLELSTTNPSDSMGFIKTTLPHILKKVPIVKTTSTSKVSKRKLGLHLCVPQKQV